MQVYTATTENITVTAQPVYLDGQSDVIRRRLVFAYFIRIQNDGDEPVRLMRRHWIIREAGGDVKEIGGDGVVGKQPRINPGEAHEYNSFCILETLEGSMEGTYLMRRDNGEEFNIAIPLFHLKASAN